jgi:hypothetical protein
LTHGGKLGFSSSLVETEPELGLIFGTRFRVGIRFMPQFTVPLVKLVEVFCCNNLVKMGRPLTAPLLPLKNIISLVNIALILHQSKSSSFYSTFYSMGTSWFLKRWWLGKKISMVSWISSKTWHKLEWITFQNAKMIVLLPTFYGL